MCTVSWRVSREGYDLFFNRDELNTRAPEVAPAIGQSEGVAFLAPRDGTSGGTWLLANDRGLTLGLLNDYGASWRPAAAVVRVSRGQIVWQQIERGRERSRLQRQRIDFEQAAFTAAVSSSRGVKRLAVVGDG